MKDKFSSEYAQIEAEGILNGSCVLRYGGILFQPGQHTGLQSVQVRTALTVGVGTIMSARNVLIIVNGHNKAKALQQGVEGGISQMWTITALQMHPKSIIVCDDAATAELKVGTYKYFLDIEKNNLDPDSLL